MKKIGISILIVGLLTTTLSAQKVRVTEQTEITKPFTTKIKTGEQCYDTTVEVPVSCGNQDSNAIGIDTLIGAGLGVILGNQIGRGNGKSAAKIGGGVLGAVIANNTRNARIKECKTYETITKCRPKYEYQTVHRTIGYNNCAYVDGQKYCKQTRSPIKYLHIKKTITVY